MRLMGSTELEAERETLCSDRAGKYPWLGKVHQV
jgi:hypothetical protein